MKILLASLLFLVPTSALAEQIESQAGYSATRKCLKSEYREEYVPGTEDQPGYVKSWKDTYEVECARGYVGAPPSYKRSVTIHEEIDTNDCSGGTLVGGLLGGGLSAALSRDDGRWWAIPIGVASGAMVGCQMDGG